MPTVLLVDDHAMIRQALCELLSSHSQLEVIAEAETAEQARTHLREQVPDLVITDLVLLEGPDGIQLTKAVKAEFPDVPVLLLSGHDEALFAERAIVAGASGYVMKDEDLETLLEAVDATLQGRIWLSSELQERLLPSVLHDFAAASVDGVDDELLAQLGAGNRTTTGLSRALGLPYMAVESQLDAAQRTLRLPSRASLFLFAQLHLDHKAAVVG